MLGAPARLLARDARTGRRRGLRFRVGVCAEQRHQGQAEKGAFEKGAHGVGRSFEGFSLAVVRRIVKKAQGFFILAREVRRGKRLRS
jgi:hypothetical protein